MMLSPLSAPSRFPLISLLSRCILFPLLSPTPRFRLSSPGYHILLEFHFAFEHLHYIICTYSILRPVQVLCPGFLFHCTCSFGPFLPFSFGYICLRFLGLTNKESYVVLLGWRFQRSCHGVKRENESLHILTSFDTGGTEDR